MFRTGLLAVSLLSTPALAALPVGSLAPTISLSGEAGGRADDSAWSGNELRGKVHVIFYTTAPKKDDNEKAKQALKKADYPRTYYGSVAVVNMASNPFWMLDSIVSQKIEESQKELPHTIHVKDMNHAFLKPWKLADDSNNVVVLDTDGRVLFSHDGVVPEPKIPELVAVIGSAIKRAEAAAASSKATAKAATPTAGDSAASHSRKHAGHTTAAK